MTDALSRAKGSLLLLPGISLIGSKGALAEITEAFAYPA
jgi:hypothetical protein